MSGKAAPTGWFYTNRVLNDDTPRFEARALTAGTGLGFSGIILVDIVCDDEDLLSTTTLVKVEQLKYVVTGSHVNTWRELELVDPGKCVEKVLMEFRFSCEPGWIGVHCNRMEDRPAGTDEGDIAKHAQIYVDRCPRGCACDAAVRTVLCDRELHGGPLEAERLLELPEDLEFLSIRRHPLPVVHADMFPSLISLHEISFAQTQTHEV